MITSIFLAGQFWLQQADPQVLVRVDSISSVDENKVMMLVDRGLYFEDHSNYTMILEALQSCKDYNE